MPASIGSHAHSASADSDDKNRPLNMSPPADPDINDLPIDIQTSEGFAEVSEDGDEYVQPSPDPNPNTNYPFVLPPSDREAYGQFERLLLRADNLEDLWEEAFRDVGFMNFYLSMMGNTPANNREELKQDFLRRGRAFMSNGVRDASLFEAMMRDQFSNFVRQDMIWDDVEHEHTLLAIRCFETASQIVAAIASVMVVVWFLQDFWK